MKFVANKDMRAVHMWGRFSADQLRAVHPMLVADGDAVETMNRFRVMRATFFDFEALDIPMLTDEQAHVHINYYMGPEAEEAASMQTLGFFERQLELAGAKEVGSRWLSRSYAGNAETILDLDDVEAVRIWAARAGGSCPGRASVARFPRRSGSAWPGAVHPRRCALVVAARTSGSTSRSR